MDLRILSQLLQAPVLFVNHFVDRIYVLQLDFEKNYHRDSILHDGKVVPIIHIDMHEAIVVFNSD